MTSQEKARDKFPPLQQVQTCFHYSGTYFPIEGEGGKEDRIVYQRSKQEKAYLTSLERQWRLPTVGEREKWAAHWSDVLNSYEDRTEIRLYCCCIVPMSGLSQCEIGLWNRTCKWTLRLKYILKWRIFYFILFSYSIKAKDNKVQGKKSTPWHREYKRGKYHCTVDLLFYWFGIICMTTDNFCFYMQNRVIQTSQTGGQQYSDTYPFSIPWLNHSMSSFQLMDQDLRDVASPPNSDAATMTSSPQQRVLIRLGYCTL